MQIFTFLYRPLFFDAPGVLGIIVSFENAFYLLLTLRILTLKGIKFMITGNFLVKTALFSFLTVTIALAQIAGNMGLAMQAKKPGNNIVFVCNHFLSGRGKDESLPGIYYTTHAPSTDWRR